VLVGLAVVALVVITVAALIDHATVSGHEALGRVMFGYPFD
jgi:hypothetical protein